MTYHLPDFVLETLRRLREGGFAAYCVGGSVRDLLLSRAPGDYDIATAATPAQVQAVFRGQRVLLTGVKHGTVTVVTRGGAVEITTFRVDGAYTDHRRPDAVTFTADIVEDLSRRDFTINAMALSDLGEVIDPFGGQADLAAGVIRCVGEPARRFAEDALRILRALRFASRYGFEIEEKTAQAMLDARQTLAHVAAERILAELCGMDFSRVSARFLPVLQVPIPELRQVAVPEGLPPAPEIQLAALLKGLPAEAILMRLKASRFLQTRVALLVRETAVPIPPDAPSIRALLNRAGEDAARQALILQENRQALETLDAVVARGDCYRLDQLAVSGKDMVEAGLSGPAVGDALEALLADVIAGRVKNTRDALLRRHADRKNRRNGGFF